ncbi:MAG: ferredoxin family protein [Anaerolineales bacterium]|jgi:2-oxoglutarate ferredoxin oxidoreductase subunit delta
MPVKGWIEVNELYCKGCGLCVSVCPQEAMALDMDHLTPKGYHPVTLVSDTCTGCGICAVVCPDAAVTILREAVNKAARALA